MKNQAHDNEFELDFMVKGRGPARLEQLAPVALAHLLRYRFEGRLKHPAHTWSIEDLTGSVGVSDISGDLSLKTGANGYGYMPILPPTRLTLCKYLGLLSPALATR